MHRDSCRERCIIRGFYFTAGDDCLDPVQGELGGRVRPHNTHRAKAEAERETCLSVGVCLSISVWKSQIRNENKMIM